MLPRIVLAAFLIAADCAVASAQTVSPVPTPTPQPGTPIVNWNVDSGVTWNVSPGFGQATFAYGLRASAAFVRSVRTGSVALHDGIGVVTIFDTAISRDSPTRVAHNERTILIGPRWDHGNQTALAFTQIVGGMKRSSETGTSMPVDWRPTFGAGAGFDAVLPVGHGMKLMWRVLELNWMITPDDPAARQRFALSTGLVLSQPLTRPR